MTIYGVCISDIKNYNEERAEKFLESLLNTECKAIANDYFENKEDGVDLNDWFYSYESNNTFYGASAFLLM